MKKVITKKVAVKKVVVETTIEQNLEEIMKEVVFCMPAAKKLYENDSASSVSVIKRKLRRVKKELIPALEKRLVNTKKSLKKRKHNVSKASLKNLVPFQNKESLHDLP